MRKSRILTVFLTIAVLFTMSFAAVPAYAASGTAITNADDLKAMENNPSGSYYLANDIEVPANLSLFTDYDYAFTGTFDGNGHKIKGYTYTSISASTKQAQWQHWLPPQKTANSRISVSPVKLPENSCDRLQVLLLTMREAL